MKRCNCTWTLRVVCAAALTLSLARLSSAGPASWEEVKEQQLNKIEQEGEDFARGRGLFPVVTVGGSFKGFRWKFRNRELPTPELVWGTPGYSWISVAAHWNSLESFSKKVGESLGTIYDAAASELTEIMSENASLDSREATGGTPGTWLAEMIGDNGLGAIPYESPEAQKHNAEVDTWNMQWRKEQELRRILYSLRAEKNTPQYWQVVYGFSRRRSSPDVVRTARDNASTAAEPANLPPWEKWKKLNATIETYDAAKNAPVESVNMFKSEYEKMAYDNILETINAGIEKNSQEIATQQAELSQLRGHLGDLGERIRQTEDTIAELKAQKARFERKLSGVEQSLQNVQASMGEMNSDFRQERNVLLQQIDDVNDSIAEAEARTASLRAQEADTMSGLQTFVGALSLVGSVASFANTMSASTYSGRSEVYNDTSSYYSGGYDSYDYSSTYSSSSYSGGGGSSSRSSGSSISTGIVDDGGLGAQTAAYIQAANAARYGSGDAHYKITQYRQ